ncbi:MAG TPA: hypothetical protein VFF30_05835 [Nitrososphaerales archaeon]|nr:hypothetical protein [Nitrososphaerales archaeon]
MSVSDEVKQRLAEQSARVRAPSRSPPIHEILIIKCLAASLNELPSRKNQLVIQAAYQVPEEMRADVSNDLLERLSLVNTTFLLARVRDDGSVGLSWPCDRTPEAFQRYIAPWIGKTRILFAYRTESEAQSLWQAFTANAAEFLPKPPNEDTWEDVRRGKYDDVIPLWAHVFFWQEILTHSTFDAMRSRFLVWAEPQIAEITATISALLSPQSRALLQQALFSQGAK